MENQIVLPTILPLEYDGKPVVTTKQLSKCFGCKEYSITANFNRNRDIFNYGEDYYFLEGAEMREFKRQLYKSTYETTDISIGNFSSHTYLWTKSGAHLLSKIINTYMAKIGEIDKGGRNF